MRNVRDEEKLWSAMTPWNKSIAYGITCYRSPLLQQGIRVLQTNPRLHFSTYDVSRFLQNRSFQSV